MRRRGGPAEPEVADEEDLGLVDHLAGDPLEFTKPPSEELPHDDVRPIVNTSRQEA
jgi:hypothetical protein